MVDFILGTVGTAILIGVALPIIAAAGFVGNVICRFVSYSYNKFRGG